MPSTKICPVELSLIPWEDCLAFQCRPTMSDEHVGRLEDLLRESEEPFPPLTVFTGEGLDDTCYLADGFHRFRALRLARRVSYPMEVHEVQDPIAEARAYSLRANATHGLARSQATLVRVYERATAMFPGLQTYGDDSIQSKTGLTKSWLCRHLKRLKDDGRINAHIERRDRQTRQRSQCKKRFLSGADAGDVARELGMSKDTVRSMFKRWKQELPIAADNPQPSGGAIPARSDTVRAPTPAPEIKDKLGRTVPEHLVPKFNTPVVKELVRSLGVAISDLDKLAGQPGWEYLDVAQAGRFVKSAQQAIKAAEYHTACPRCSPDSECKLCRGAGFITSIQHARLDDREQAALVPLPQGEIS